MRNSTYFARAKISQPELPVEGDPCWKKTTNHFAFGGLNGDCKFGDSNYFNGLYNKGLSNTTTIMKTIITANLHYTFTSIGITCLIFYPCD